MDYQAYRVTDWNAYVGRDQLRCGPSESLTDVCSCNGEDTNPAHRAAGLWRAHVSDFRRADPMIGFQRTVKLMSPRWRSYIVNSVSLPGRANIYNFLKIVTSQKNWAERQTLDEMAGPLKLTRKRPWSLTWTLSIKLQMYCRHTFTQCNHWQRWSERVISKQTFGIYPTFLGTFLRASHEYWSHSKCIYVSRYKYDTAVFASISFDGYCSMWTFYMI